MADQAHLLIVEDDELVQKLLAAYLEKDGYLVSTAGTGKEMYRCLEQENIDLILLDLGLPDEDGLALARQIRARSSVPIVVLTARQGRDDRITALGNGVDDYLTKPVDPEELGLRVENLLRRSGGQEGDGAAGATQEVINFAGWRLDISADALTGPGGIDVRLTRGEFDLLTCLAKAPNRVLTRAFLLDAIVRDAEGPSDRVIDVLISRLRKKMEANPCKPEIIQTVTGRGYKLVS